MLGVNESTVKRWADNGDIKCFRTPGGHRKFILGDVIDFAKKYSFGLSIKGLQNNTLVVSDNPGRNSITDEILLKKMLYGTETDVYNYLGALLNNGMPVTEIYDKVILNVMSEIGSMWLAGKIGIEGEHIASNKLMKSLVLLKNKTEPRSPNGLTAMCGCLEDELHEIGIMSIANILSYHGWNVIYLGVNMPAESFAGSILKYKPDIVCISSTRAGGVKKLSGKLLNIRRASRIAGAKLALGGQSAVKFSGRTDIADVIILTMKELTEYTRETFNT